MQVEVDNAAMKTFTVKSKSLSIINNIIIIVNIISLQQAILILNSLSIYSFATGFF